MEVINLPRGSDIQECDMLVNASLVVMLEEVIAILNLYYYGCVFLVLVLIQDHLDHCASKEPMNPLWEMILWFL